MVHSLIVVPIENFDVFRHANNIVAQEPNLSPITCIVYVDKHRISEL